jgi:ATP-dependent DNA ligase
MREAKHNGYRLLARKDAGRVALRSRYGEDWRKLPLEVRRAQLALLVAGIKALSVGLRGNPGAMSRFKRQPPARKQSHDR